MRRTVATLLVVASPLLLSGPVSAQDRPAPAIAPVPAAPVTVQGIAPTTPAPESVAAPAVPSAVTAPAVTPQAVPLAAHSTVKKMPGIKTAAGSGLDDTAYAARLQADLCQARQIFCGLDHNGRYPAG